MKNRKRVSGRSRRKSNAPYKSGLEKRLAEGPLKDWKYEPTKLKFVQPAKSRSYTPDYSNDDETIYIEAKGRISSLDELLKVVWCREQYPDKTFVWVLQNPHGRAYPQSKTTLRDWLTKKGFKWISVSDLEEKGSSLINDMVGSKDTTEELLEND